MTPFPGSPKLLRGGLVLVDPPSGTVKRVITLQYNPDSISHTLQVQGIGEGGDRSEALRLRGRRSVAACASRCRKAFRRGPNVGAERSFMTRLAAVTAGVGCTGIYGKQMRQ